MRRGVKYGLWALGTLATVVLLVVLWLFWLFYTSSGARFAVNLAAGAAGFDLAVQQVEGRLIDTLQLKGVRLAQPKLQIRVESVVVRWQLLRLLNRRLKIQELVVVGVQVQDDRPPTAEPPKLHLPKLPAGLRRFSVQADLLKLKGLTYRHMQTPPTRVTEITSQLTLDDGLLTLSEILLVSPQGRLSGDVAAGLLTPSLKLDLSALPARPVREMDFFSLNTDLVPAKKPEEMAGPMAFIGKRRGTALLDFKGNLGIGENLVNLHDFRLVQPKERGSLTGDASMVFADPEPLYTLALKAKELDLTRELKTPTNITGILNFSGSLSRFTGNFDLTNKGEGWQSMSLASDFRGDPGGVKLLNLRGKALEGTVAGNLNFAWTEGTKVSGDLAGRGLNPELLAEGWPGRVSLNLKGNLQFPEKGETTGALRAKILESRLQGRTFQGEVAGAFIGEKVRVDRLLLTGKGFNITGSGALHRRLNLSARVSDLSELVPEASGALNANGWLRWRDGMLSAAAKGEGRNVAASGVSARTLRLDARLGEGKGYPVYLDAALSGFRAGRLQADKALVNLRGTADSHRATASLTSPATSAELALAGGYSDGTWKGTLTRFSGHDAVGPWTLAKPAPLLLSGERIRVSPLLVTGAPGERLQLGADLNPGTSTGTLSAEWNVLNLARANAWVDGMELEGATTGDLDLRLLSGNRIALKGSASAQGALAADGRRVELDGLAASFSGGRSGLRAEVDAVLEGGTAHLTFNSAEPASLALPRRGDMALQWSCLDLAAANPWMTGAELEGRTSGDLNLSLFPGRRISLSGNAYAEGALETETTRVELDRVAASVTGDRSGFKLQVDAVLEEGKGDARLSFNSPDPVALAFPRRGDLALQWSNFDLALLEPATDTDLVLQGKSQGVVAGKLSPGKGLDLSGNAKLEQGHVNWQGRGDEFDASIDTAQAEFRWRGDLDAPAKGELELKAVAQADGRYNSGGERIASGRMTLRADTGRAGTAADLQITLEEGGALKATVSSNAPATAGIPERAELAVEWGGIHSALLRPWLPGELNLDGILSGKAGGRLMPGQRLEMAGEAQFAQGRAEWQGENGAVNAQVRSARVDWSWRGDTLTGTLNLALADYGNAGGEFLLPIPARLPVTPDPNGTLRGNLAGRVVERGFLTTFLPGLVQETKGDLDLDLRLSGTWSDPRLNGELNLARAAAYIPSAGITVTDVQLSARLADDRLLVEGFRAKSGEGEIVGSLEARLDGWQLAQYSGNLKGTNLQTVYLPELQMVTSPSLTFNGGGDTVVLRGELLIPKMLISGPPARSMVTPSGDVIMESAQPTPVEKRSPLKLDGRVKVVLGDKVEVKASGIDARLTGSMDLVLEGLESITSSGEIRVAKGNYRAYGLDLEIVRGRLYYVNDPVDQPTLDILALRTVGDVKAGVTVAGAMKAPIVKLYSEPAMPEVDILAYMMLGHPLGTGSTEQGALLATAATSLFSLGQSSSVQEQIKDRLGLSTLGLTTVDTSGTGTMGYQAVKVTPTGAAPGESTAAESLFTVGKYLTPELYLSYGRSLVTGSNLFMLRYDITKRIQVETRSGTESGVDIYYKWEFK